MAKTKTPFFSLDAHGSVGESVTAQKRGKETLVRKKPLPADPYSLPQAYQRWLYQEFACLWRQQSLATRQEYASAGVRFHLTGFQYWMKDRLAKLSYIEHWSKLDEGLGAVSYDSSRNDNNGVILGASPAVGAIDGCYHFDGLNDRIIYNPVAITQTGSFDFLMKADPTQNAFAYVLVYTSVLGTDRLHFQFRPAWTLRFQLLRGGISAGFVESANPLNDDKWHYICGVWNSTGMSIYVDDLAPVTQAGDMTATLPADTYLCLGRFQPTAMYHYTGYLDNAFIRSRVLDATEIARNAERRYP